MSHFNTALIVTSVVGLFAGLFLAWMHHQLKTLHLSPVAAYCFGSVVNLLAYTCALAIFTAVTLGGDVTVLSWAGVAFTSWVLWVVSLVPALWVKNVANANRVAYYTTSSLFFLYLQTFMAALLVSSSDLLNSQLTMLWGIWIITGAINALTYFLDWRAGEARRKKVGEIVSQRKGE